MAGLSTVYVERAVAAAQKSLHRQHHGAVLILDDNHIVSAYNYGYMHAERYAVIKAGSRAQDATLLVLRVGVAGQLMNSRPCSQCRKLIRKYNLTTWYSDVDGNIVKFNSSDN